MNKGDVIFLSNAKFFENFFSDNPIKNKLGRFSNGILISESHNPQFFSLSTLNKLDSYTKYLNQLAIQLNQKDITLYFFISPPYFSNIDGKTCAEEWFRPSWNINKIVLKIKIKLTQDKISLQIILKKCQ